MKTFLRQFLTLGGFYAVISYVLTCLEQEIANIIIFLLLLIMIIFLIFKKSFKILGSFQQKYPRLNFYIMSLGVAEYIGLIIISIPALIYGYNSAFSQYNNVEYDSIIPTYLNYASVVYRIVLITVIAWATYINFIKKQKV